ncbi:DUF1592 domain-containing protein [Humisphaera borealis]|uniref:DUF1592 domain-containing protein n=1 Tax=Humisphaera borealis TaxID=2807512 RepID=UPI0019D0BCFE|nr:DUF1592 domain-containing protein [Humisphaera borealis]
MTPSATAAPPPAAFLEQHCYSCHDGDAKKGGIDLTALKLQLDDRDAFQTWVKVHDAVANGDMPPKKKPRPSEADSSRFLADLDKALVAADESRIARQGRATFRRLTRVEYENAVRDLLDLPHLEIKEILPADGSRHGFDKVGEALDLSHVQLARYLEAADRALDAAIATRVTPPPVVKRRIYPTESFKFHMNLKLGSAILLKDGQPDPIWPVAKEKHDAPDMATIKSPDFFKLKQSVALLTPNLEGWLKSMTFAPMFAGKYRLRLSTWSFHWNAGKIEPLPAPQAVRLYVHPRTLGYFDAPSLAPTVHEITPWLEMGDEVIFDPASFFWTGLQIHQRKGGGGLHVGPAVVVDWMEVEGPLYEQWPPESHRRLFGDLPLKPFDAATGLKPPTHAAPVQKLGYGWPKPWEIPPGDSKPQPLVTVASPAPLEDAKRLLANFLPRAFRRDVSDAEIMRYVGLVQQRLEKKDCFELAMRHAYKAALTSTQFLFRKEAPGTLDDLALATRLSFWLWNSTPDAQLLSLAKQNQLHEPETLHAQVERLLSDPRSDRFITEFLDQWLKLRDIDATDPDQALYPEYHLYLKESMLAESRAFFRELIAKDLPAVNIVASDFAMLNQRLAGHYGIKDVVGNAIRRVPLPPDSHRGGFLTQASVLKVTANGTVSSPVVRGVFVTERLLGRPIPPVPPGVAAIDPDTRGATTIREQLAKHRTDASCAACHLKMDPPGLALESYDVIGGYRDRYRSLDKGTSGGFKFPDGQGVRYKAGPPVDASGETAQAEPFQNFADFQRLTVAKPETVARAFAAQMITYATGAEPGYADRREVDRILSETKAQQYGIRSLVHAVSQSRLFQHK